jgi:hypothetical protein
MDGIDHRHKKKKDSAVLDSECNIFYAFDHETLPEKKTDYKTTVWFRIEWDRRSLCAEQRLSIIKCFHILRHVQGTYIIIKSV